MYACLTFGTINSISTTHRENIALKVTVDEYIDLQGYTYTTHILSYNIYDHVLYLFANAACIHRSEL